MGLFGMGKSNEERTEIGMQKASDLAAGKGISGRIAKKMMGAEQSALLQSGVDAYRSTQAASAAQAAGEGAARAQVTEVADTGMELQLNPVVDLSLTLDDGGTITVRTVVSKVQIPRVGDTVQLFANPADPSGYAYGGLVVA